MRQKGFVFLPILLIVGSLSFLGYFIYKNEKIQSIVFPNDNQNADTTSGINFSDLIHIGENKNKEESKSLTTVDTENWKTYEDKQYGIVFKYPNNFSTNRECIVAVYNPAGIDYESDVNPSEMIKIVICGRNMAYGNNDIDSIFERSLYSSWKNGEKANVYKKTRIKINGSDAIRATVEGLEGEVENSIFTYKNYIFTIIAYNSDVVDMSIYNTLLNTISFNEVETREGLAGYINNLTNYGFNYPGYWRGSKSGTNIEFDFENANLKVSVKPVSSDYTLDSVKTEITSNGWKKTKINNIDFLYFENKSPITNNLSYVSYFALYKNNLYNLYLSLSWENPEIPQTLVNQFYELLNSFRFL